MSCSVSIYRVINFVLQRRNEVDFSKYARYIQAHKAHFGTEDEYGVLIIPVQLPFFYAFTSKWLMFIAVSL